MTLREIDDALAAWNDRLSAAAHNLMDLQSEPTYQCLTGTGGVAKVQLQGASAARVEPAVGAMTNVFQHFGLLNETIDRAGRLRRDVPTLFGAESKIREIYELLAGKSIRLPAVDVPFEQRTLLSGVENVEFISPGNLLEIMVRAFQAARDAVVAVDAAWSKLGASLSAAARRIQSLRIRAGSINGSWLADLDAAERALRDARSKLQSDPLNAAAGAQDRILPLLDRVEHGVEIRERLLQQIAGGLSAAHGKLDNLAALHQEAVDASAEARQKIAGAESLPAPLPADKVEALRVWLGRLETRYHEGILEPVAIGLRNWNTAAENCVSEEGAIRDANRGPLDARNELRGRLDALKAKARAYGVAEDDGLVELAQEAEKLLYQRPAVIDRAAALVKAYERKLNGPK